MNLLFVASEGNYGQGNGSISVFDNDQKIQEILDIGDHGISLGIYFADPDGNQIEVFYELPKEEWPEEEMFSGNFPYKFKV